MSVLYLFPCFLPVSLISLLGPLQIPAPSHKIGLVAGKGQQEEQDHALDNVTVSGINTHVQHTVGKGSHSNHRNHDADRTIAEPGKKHTQEQAQKRIHDRSHGAKGGGNIDLSVAAHVDGGSNTGKYTAEGEAQLFDLIYLQARTGSQLAVPAQGTDVVPIGGLIGQDIVQHERNAEDNKNVGRLGQNGVLHLDDRTVVLGKQDAWQRLVHQRQTQSHHQKGDLQLVVQKTRQAGEQHRREEREENQSRDAGPRHVHEIASNDGRCGHHSANREIHKAQGEVGHHCHNDNGWQNGLSQYDEDRSRREYPSAGGNAEEEAYHEGKDHRFKGSYEKILGFS